MAYIGKSPAVGNFIKLDAITTSATATYNLLNGGVAYSPESVNHMLVSLNGVIQSPTTAFTVAGTQIIFASTLSSSDVIDFIMVYGDVLNIGVPSDNTVSNAKIVDMAASKLTGALPAISGAALTALNATNIGSGTVPTARLGSGTASRSVFLSGANTWIAAGGGKINQVIQTSKTDTFSSSSGSFTDITGMSAAITPTATSSKVLVLVNMNVAVTATDRYAFFQLFRTTTAIHLGGVASNRQPCSFVASLFGSSVNIQEKSIMFLDSPSTTSATTYKMQGLVQSDSSPSFVVNRTNADDDTAANGRTASTITLMEVLA